MSVYMEHLIDDLVHAWEEGVWTYDRARKMLVLCNVTNKIRKRTDTAVTFTQECSGVSYPQRNVSILSKGLGSSKGTH